MTYIILGMALISVLLVSGCTSQLQTEIDEIDERCHAAWEGRYDDTGSGVSPYQVYENYCFLISTQEECQNSTDIVNYNTETNSFQTGDGLPDCEWR